MADSLEFEKREVLVTFAFNRQITIQNACLKKMNVSNMADRATSWILNSAVNMQ